VWDVEVPIFSIDNRLTDSGKIFSLTRRPLFTCKKDSWYSFLLEAESIPGLDQLKKSTSSGLELSAQYFWKSTAVWTEFSHFLRSISGSPLLCGLSSRIFCAVFLEVHCCVDSVLAFSAQYFWMSLCGQSSVVSLAKLHKQERSVPTWLTSVTCSQLNKSGNNSSLEGETCTVLAHGGRALWSIESSGLITGPHARPAFYVSTERKQRKPQADSLLCNYFFASRKKTVLCPMLRCSCCRSQSAVHMSHNVDRDFTQSRITTDILSPLYVPSEWSQPRKATFPLNYVFQNDHIFNRWQSSDMRRSVFLSACNLRKYLMGQSTQL
jgi:hypothetical protein